MQGCRQSQEPNSTASALLLGRLSASGFGLAWLCTVLLSDVPRVGGDWKQRAAACLQHCLSSCCIGLPLYSAVLASTALIHGDQLTGAFAVLAVQGWLVASITELSWPAASLPNEQKEESDRKKRRESPKWWRNKALLRRGALRWVLASLLVTFLALAAFATSYRSQLRPFMLGAILSGHVSCLGAVIFLATKWTHEVENMYIAWQALALIAFSMVYLLGWLREAPSLKGGASTFLLLYLLSKQFELELVGTSVSLNLLAAFIILQHIVTTEQFLKAMFDPKNLYAS